MTSFVSKRTTIKKCFSNNAVPYICVLLFLLSIIIRTVFLLLTDRIAEDSYTYILYAEILKSSHWNWEMVYPKGHNVHFPPMLISIMAIGGSLGIGTKLTGQIFCLICGSLVPVGVFLCSDRIFKKRLFALFAGLLIVVHPYFIEISANVLRDAPYHCFFIFSLLLAIRAIDSEKLVWWALFGLVSGIASLMRREGIELIAICIIWNLFYLAKSKKNFSNATIIVCKQLAVALLCYLLITLPLWLYIRLNTDSVWELFPYSYLLLKVFK